MHKHRGLTATFLLLLTFSLIAPVHSVLAAGLPENILLKDLKGNTVQLNDLYKGKVTVIVFWATWCIPCKKELPDLNKYYEEAKEKGVEIISISTDTTRDLAKVRPYVSTRRFSYPVLLDTESRLAKLLNPRGILPYTVILDRQGQIELEKVGYRSGDLNKFKATIEELLKAEIPVGTDVPEEPKESGGEESASVQPE